MAQLAKVPGFPGIYTTKTGLFVVKWQENKKTKRTSFKSLSAAVEYRKEQGIGKCSPYNTAKGRAALERQEVEGRPTPPPPQPGNAYGKTHGAKMVVTKQELDTEVARIYKELPIKHDADRMAVEQLADLLVRMGKLDSWLEDSGGIVDDRGQVKSPESYRSDLQSKATRMLRELGMTPKARAELGVDLMMTAALAGQMRPHAIDLLDGRDPIEFEPAARRVASRVLLGVSERVRSDDLAWARHFLERLQNEARADLIIEATIEESELVT